jgi:hypothetical protein
LVVTLVLSAILNGVQKSSTAQLDPATRFEF